MPAGPAGYKRVLVKISGDGFCKPGASGVDPDEVESIAGQVARIHEAGVELAIVVGAGNILRGREFGERGMNRATADHMGMLATIINTLALQDAIERHGVDTRAMSAIPVVQVAEPYIRRRAVHHLEKSRIIILAGGTGNPFFTTDTAAALRAVEIGAEVLLKATKVDGVYSADPETHPDAVLYDRLDYLDVLNSRLHVMDSTAISLCMDNGLRIIVFNLTRKGNMEKVVAGERIGTIVGV